MIGDWRQLALRTRGRIVAGDPARRPSGVSIDTRTLDPGDAFFAIRGPVHDGNRFAADAVRAGASGIVVEDASAIPTQLPAGAVALVVEDGTRALQDAAAAARTDARLEVAAITGSVGKTTTKELVRLLVAGDRAVHASPGNLNNHHGLPLAILRVPEDVRTCVLELGISTPGEMDRLVEIARPDVGLVTVVSAVHVGNFGTFADLCDEKMKLPRGSARAILNADDPEQVARRTTVTAPVAWFGTQVRAGEGGIRLSRVETRGLRGFVATFTEVHVEGGADGESVVVECPLPGEHQARNLLAACALARALGVPWSTVRRQAQLALPARRRGEVHDVAGATLFDDSYNANPLAMRAALRLLADVPSAGRRIAVLGDMLELGDRAADEHGLLGEAASEVVDVLVGVGPESARAVEAARAAGLDALHLADADAAGEWLVRTVRAGDVVLVKGSRGVGLDRAVDAVMAAHPRQGASNPPGEGASNPSSEGASNPSSEGASHPPGEGASQ